MNPEQQWRPVSASQTDTWTLPPDQVHVWRLQLDADHAVGTALARVLSEEEKSKARRIHLPQQQAQYVQAHGTLRVLLAAYMGCDAGELHFSKGAHGKPALRTSHGTPALHFNLSHSRDCALLAVAARREVGVDVEYVRPETPVMKMARRFYTQGEYINLEAMPDVLRRQAFFLGWTRKEAIVKAMGRGIVRALDKVEVSMNPHQPPAWLASFDDSDLVRWDVRDLPPIPGYAAAIVAAGNDWSLQCRQWTDDLYGQLGYPPRESNSSQRE
jgi:4'-phosphopantetheinyl transferase